jgi:uncharacterized membrane protein YqjE
LGVITMNGTIWNCLLGLESSLVLQMIMVAMMALVLVIQGLMGFIVLRIVLSRDILLYRV